MEIIAAIIGSLILIIGGINLYKLQEKRRIFRLLSSSGSWKSEECSRATQSIPTVFDSDGSQCAYIDWKNSLNEYFTKVTVNPDTPTEYSVQVSLQSDQRPFVNNLLRELAVESRIMSRRDASRHNFSTNGIQLV